MSREEYAERYAAAAVKAYATDLAERLRKAAKNLDEMGQDRGIGDASAERLHYKAEGVRLALSYVEEVLR